jgi:hypothetical protein
LPWIFAKFGGKEFFVFLRKMKDGHDKGRLGFMTAAQKHLGAVFELPQSKKFYITAPSVFWAAAMKPDQPSSCSSFIRTNF